jgi:hypothetical protein
LGIEKGSFAGRGEQRAGCAGPYGAGAWSLQRPIARLSAFSSRVRSVLTAKSAKYGILIPNPPMTHARNSRNFYVLLCMFNGFAIARPFCQAIKVSLTGVEF